MLAEQEGAPLFERAAAKFKLLGAREQWRESIHKSERFVELFALLQVGQCSHQVIAELFNWQHVTAIDGNDGERFEHASISKQRRVDIALLTEQVSLHERSGKAFVRIAVELARAGILFEGTFSIAFEFQPAGELVIRLIG